ncbi:MAG: LamG domain-containing protein [Victivallales bacterium]|jgi:hypothetical protein
MKKRMRMGWRAVLSMGLFSLSSLAYSETLEVKPVSGQEEEYADGKFEQGLKVMGSCFLNYTNTPQVFSCKEGTVATWFKQETHCFYKSIFDQAETGKKNRLCLYIGPTNEGNQNCPTGIVRFSLVDDNGKERLLLSKTVINLGTWYHVAITWNKGVAKLYLNGVEENSAENVGALGKSGPMLHIASNFGNSCTFIGGILDEFIILDRSLDAKEIAELYTAKESFKPTPNTRLYLNFNGNNKGVSSVLPQ